MHLSITCIPFLDVFVEAEKHRVGWGVEFRRRPDLRPSAWDLIVYASRRTVHISH